MNMKKCPRYDRLIFRIHALRQMFQRGISDTDVHQLLEQGVIIEEYPDDIPYSSCLISGFIVDRPLHVVLAYNNVDREVIIITAYQPDPEQWDNNFTRRKK